MERKRYQPVKVRNISLGDGNTKICVPLVAANQEDIGRQLELIQSGPHDLVEWRVDFYEGHEEWEQVRAALGMIRRRLDETPLLFTFRTKPEGGESDITLEAYRELCQRAADTGMVDLIDLEYHLGGDLLRELVPELHQAGAAVIGSCHDFARTMDAEEIIEILRSMQLLGVDITKMAVMPECRKDVLTLLRASVEMEEKFADRPFITMSMGKMGAISRIAAEFTGSAFTFAAAGRASAPGQMSADGIETALGLLR
ncbi:MAG: type I 3-dehydroquinate dehydratase [Lachnospiraceae bacterium]|nr:type I 3-dehydroquinate dehydratase [Lachnospiraceae bacterium]